MKNRLVAAAALFTAATVATIGLASPAQASGYVKYGSYGWGDQCLSIGSNGATNHTWTAYYCTTVTPSGATGPGLYNLYVSY
jgi:hypothetical protein